MFSALSCSIHLARNVPDATSQKTRPVAAGGAKLDPCLPRSRNTAMPSRVTVDVGQYGGGAPAPHPVEIASRPNCSIHLARKVDLVTSEKTSPFAAGGW